MSGFGGDLLHLAHPRIMPPAADLTASIWSPVTRSAAHAASRAVATACCRRNDRPFGPDERQALGAHVSGVAPGGVDWSCNVFSFGGVVGAGHGQCS